MHRNINKEMRTNLDRDLKSISDAKAYLNELFDNDEAYAPGTEIDYIVTKAERIKLDCLMVLCQSFKDFDPLEYLMKKAEDSM